MSGEMLYFELISPRRCVFEGSVKQVTLPGTKGEMCILPGHASMLARLDAGVVRFVDEKGNKLMYAVKPGFVQVHENGVKALIGRAWNKEELDKEGFVPEPLPSDTDEAYNVRLLNEAKAKVQSEV